MNWFEVLFNEKYIIKHKHKYKGDRTDLKQYQFVEAIMEKKK